MRDLTPDEQNLWSRVAGTITPMGVTRKQGFVTVFQTRHPYLRSWVLDLHGLKVYDAFLAVKMFIENAYLDSVTRVTIVTGKSGVIRKEFPDWINYHPVQRCELLIGGGAYRVFLTKKPITKIK